MVADRGWPVGPGADDRPARPDSEDPSAPRNRAALSSARVPPVHRWSSTFPAPISGPARSAVEPDTRCGAAERPVRSGWAEAPRAGRRVHPRVRASGRTTLPDRRADRRARHSHPGGPVGSAGPGGSPVSADRAAPDEPVSRPAPADRARPSAGHVPPEHRRPTADQTCRKSSAARESRTGPRCVGTGITSVCPRVRSSRSCSALHDFPPHRPDQRPYPVVMSVVQTTSRRRTAQRGDRPREPVARLATVSREPAAL